MSIGQRLKDLRKTNKFTMEELSAELNSRYDVNINKSMISKWENNVVSPSVNTATAYSKYFDVTLDYILGIEPTEEKTTNNMKKYTTSDRLKYLFDTKNLKQIEVSKATKLSPSTLNQYITGVSTPKEDRIERLANYFGVSPVWLMGYDVAMTPEPKITEKEDLPISNAQMLDPKNFKVLDVPIYGRASAGNGYINLDEEVEYMAVIGDSKIGIDTFGVKVYGNSMDDGTSRSIMNGSLVFANPFYANIDHYLGSLFVITYDECTYIKVVDKLYNRYALISYNEDYEPIILRDLEKVIIRGIIVKVMYYV